MGMVVLPRIWPKRMALSEYRDIGYTGVRIPDIRTLQRRIDRQEMPGEQQGKTYYVWIGPHYELMDPPHIVSQKKQIVEQAQSTTGNERADKLLAEWFKDQGDDPTKTL